MGVFAFERNDDGDSCIKLQLQESASDEIN
jgi:hypothetical protein